MKFDTAYSIVCGLQDLAVERRLSEEAGECRIVHYCDDYEALGECWEMEFQERALRRDLFHRALTAMVTPNLGMGEVKYEPDDLEEARIWASAEHRARAMLVAMLCDPDGEEKEAEVWADPALDGGEVVEQTMGAVGVRCDASPALALDSDAYAEAGIEEAIVEGVETHTKINDGNVCRVTEPDAYAEEDDE